MGNIVKLPGKSASVTLFLTVAGLLAYWLWMAWPRTLVEPGQAVASAGGIRLECLSYAPFRRPGESPFNAGAHVSVERLRLDLKLISAVSQCVRTYSVDQGLDRVPEVARELGLKVLLGAWIGRDRKQNDRELEQAFKLANAHADVIAGLIVGNEVLLRRELPPEVLAGYVDRARATVKVPVTYADVWEFWVRNQELARKVSFATIHILPYWEDDPVPIEQAVPHVLNIVRHVREKMPGVALMIGETGWPSAGRTRHGAVPSLVNQARFAREFAVEAPRLGVPYNFIEAYDQPWKRRLEGAMGGNWGLLDSDGEQKFAIAGAVAEFPRLWIPVGLTLLGAGLAVALAALTGLLRGHPAVFGLAGAALGATALAQWRYLWAWNRTTLEWSATLAFTLATLVVFACAVVRSSNAWGGASDALKKRVVDGFAHGRLLVLFGAAVLAVLHVFDARYRGFPWPLYVLPAAAFAIARGMPFWRDGLEERVLAVLVLFCAVWMVRAETLANDEALGFIALLVFTALAAVDFNLRLMRLRSSGGPAPAR